MQCGELINRPANSKKFHAIALLSAATGRNTGTHTQHSRWQLDNNGTAIAARTSMTTAQKQMSCNNIELLHTLLWQPRICLLFLPPFLLFACFCKLLLLRLLCLLLLCPLKHRLPLFAQAMISRNDQHFSLALSPPPAAPSLASCLLSLWRQHFKFICFAQTKRAEKCKKKNEGAHKKCLEKKIKTPSASAAHTWRGTCTCATVCCSLYYHPSQFLSGCSVAVVVNVVALFMLPLLAGSVAHLLHLIFALHLQCFFSTCASLLFRCFLPQHIVGSWVKGWRNDVLIWKILLCNFLFAICNCHYRRIVVVVVRLAFAFNKLPVCF